MKTASDKLFRLIHSMTPAEKRYFKRHYGSETNKLTHLFDAINAQQSYDEEAIKDQFQNKTARNLKVYKFQLEQLLLKGLASHRDQSTHAFKWRMMLSGFDILLDKGLLNMAGKQLEKLRQLTADRQGWQYLGQWAYAAWRLKQTTSQGCDFSKNMVLALPDTDPARSFFTLLPALNKAVDSALDRCYARQSASGIQWSELKSAAPCPGEDEELWTYLTQAFKNVASPELQLGTEQLLNFCQQMSEDVERRVQWGAYELAARRCLIRIALGSGNQAVAAGLIADGLAFTEDHPAFRGHSAYFGVLKIRGAIKWGDLPAALAVAQEQWKILQQKEEISAFPIYWLTSWIALGNICTGDLERSQRFIDRLKGQKAEPVFRAIGLILEMIHHFEAAGAQQCEALLANGAWKKVQGNLSSSFFPAWAYVFREIVRGSDDYLVEIKRLQARREEFMDDPLFRLFSRLELDQWLEAQKNGYSLSRQMQQKKAPDLSLC